MGEIPEHLLRRAQEARARTEAQRAGSQPTSGSSDSGERVADAVFGSIFGSKAPGGGDIRDDLADRLAARRAADRAARRAEIEASLQEFLAGDDGDFVNLRVAKVDGKLVIELKLDASTLTNLALLLDDNLS